MKRIKNNMTIARYFFFLCLGMLAFASCRKEEYMPPAVGEIIPYEDSISMKLDNYLATSPYTLFNQAWQKSSLKDLLSTPSTTKYTILIPENTALQSSGWSETAINAASVESLDAYLKRYVLMGRITESQLLNRGENYPAVSLLADANLRYANSTLYSGVTYDFYRFHALLGISQNQLIVNGREQGVVQAISTEEATVYPIEHVLALPTKTAWQYLKEDSRFSLYTSLLEYTDNWYKEIFRVANGYAPSEGHALAQTYNRNSAVRYKMTTERSVEGYDFIPVLSTWFIPTNEAFEKAGFHSLDDLIAYNRSRTLPQAVWHIPGGTTASYYRIVGEFATDSLLDNHHNWGRRSASIEFAATSAKWSLFFTNDLRSELLGNYMINYQLQPIYLPGTIGTPLGYEGVAQYIPFDIQRTSSAINLQSKETQKIAKLVEGDVLTLNGVIHVLDNILAPEGF
ncbi:fasciclin domain-containing protein [Sphingobacterium sp. LRF_L2]|uniref:fasciclin domain-containing protein n=1 Tax=Sphingobacterium sp. LRF_L2 TaxID=3369421 RepID=UPI003F63ADC1